jgi:hypothetical protein
VIDNRSLFKCHLCTMKEGLYTELWINWHKECRRIQAERQKDIQKRAAARIKEAASHGRRSKGRAAA